MRTYVFLTNSITNMGGAQMLIRNKMMDLESRGWNVQIFYYFSGDDIIISEFKKFSNNRIKELQYPFYAFGVKERNRIIDSIADKLKTSEEVVIESNFFQLSFWGELIAAKVGGINLLYFIGEAFPRISRKEEEFLLFKQNRNEFVNSLSIKEKYSPLIASLHNDDVVFKMPSYNNVYSDVEFPLEYDNSHPVITSIGRLEKNYILPMVNGIIEFAEANDRIVNLFFVGDAEYPIFLEQIKSVLSKTSKVIPYFFGYMYPIPLSIIRATDVGIAVSGSVKVTASQSIPTISYCVEDCQPLGVYGHTTNGRLFRTTEPVVSLSSVLSNIIIEGKYKEPVAFEDVDSAKIYERNSRILESLIKNTRCYYDCDSVYSALMRIKVKVKKLLRSSLGSVEILKKCYRFVKNLF